MEKYCQSCGRVFKDSDFKLCPYCGNKLSTRTGRQPIPRKLRHQVFQRDNYRCRECGATNKQTRLHVDHIKPVAKGGTNDLSNLQTLCEECNRAKYTDEWVGGENTNSYKVSDSIYYKNIKQCPECGTFINHKAKKCIKCNYNFNKTNEKNNFYDVELYELNSVQRQLNLDNYERQKKKEELKIEEELDKELIEIYGTKKMSKLWKRSIDLCCEL